MADNRRTRSSYNGGQSPYGQDRYRRDPYGQEGYQQDPYGQEGYRQDPYGQAGYRQDPYAAAGRQQSPYGQGGYQQDPYAQAGYQQDPYAASGRRQSPYGQGGTPDLGGRPPAQRKKVNPAIPLAIILVALALVGVGAWFLINRLSVVPVTVNGLTVEMKKGTTVQTLLDEGYATPVPGNLLAIDGSVITVGGGEPYAITVAGAPAGADYELTGATDVVIGDGADVTEESTVTEETIPFDWSDSSREFEAYWYGSIHRMSDGQNGVRTVRTGNVSGISISEDTVPAIAGGYRNYSLQTDEKVIALTFDDGPWPETTDAILDVLEQYGAKATFFTIGEQIPGREDVVRRAASIGCEVCTHTWDHASGSGQGVNLTYMSPDEQIWEVTTGYQAIADALGYEPAHILRAPGGNFYGDIIDTLWPYVDAEIGWDIDTEDWRLPGSDAILEMIYSAQPGYVILMHDGGGDRWQTVEAVRQAVPTLMEQGWRFVTVSELLAMG